jgi:hypothetical protein
MWPLEVFGVGAQAVGWCYRMYNVSYQGSLISVLPIVSSHTVCQFSTVNTYVAIGTSFM